jgi:hypothetical protein
VSGRKKRPQICSRLEKSPRQCRYAGILNLTVQGGHGQFNFGFIELAMLTPIKQNSVTDANEWFKDYKTIANTAGTFSLL